MPRNLPSLLSALAFILLTAGCIHTYPSDDLIPDNPVGVDPNDRHLQLFVSMDYPWAYLHKSPRRLIVAATDPAGHVTTGSFTVGPDIVFNRDFRILLPGLFRNQTYTLDVWIDYLNPSTQEPAAYDASSVTLIKPTLPLATESDFRAALVFHGQVDIASLRPLSKADDPATDGHRTVEYYLTATPALGRFELLPTDYTEFLSYTEDARIHGERYYFTVTYNTSIPGAYDLLSDCAVLPLDAQSFTTDFNVIDFPGLTFPIVSDWLFTDADTPLEVNLSISLFNSSQVLMARTDDVAFTVRRGETTTVTGAFLTKLITGGLQIDTRWDDDITIDLDP